MYDVWLQGQLDSGSDQVALAAGAYHPVPTIYLLFHSGPTFDSARPLGGIVPADVTADGLDSIDFNGDGVPDLLAGGEFEDPIFFVSDYKVYLLQLSPQGDVMWSQEISTGGVGGFTGATSDGFGVNIAGIGDVNGDM